MTKIKQSERHKPTHATRVPAKRLWCRDGTVPGSGLSAQTTSYSFDTMGRAWKITQPDGTSVTNEFFLTGELRKTYGSRTYPVEYSYDYAGRMQTMYPC